MRPATTRAGFPRGAEAGRIEDSTAEEPVVLADDEE